MEFNEYQQLAARTSILAQDDTQYKLMLLSMGLAGESGEAIDKIKKLVNNEKGVLTDEKRSALVSELGDVLWYLSQLAVTLGSSLEDVAQANITKLAERAARGMVVKGEGDNR
jgi:NTP pyrophosphatase (non-canonical NTP hydrolase)